MVPVSTSAVSHYTAIGREKTISTDPIWELELRKRGVFLKVSQPQSSPNILSEDSLINKRFTEKDLMLKAITTALWRLRLENLAFKSSLNNTARLCLRKEKATTTRKPGVVQVATCLASRSTGIGPP